MRVLSSLATEYVSYRVTATDYDGAAIDLSGDTVRLAFVAVGTEPGDADWHNATWVSPSVAGVLVGADPGIPVDVGVHDVWIQVLDTPEHPAQKVDVLRIT